MKHLGERVREELSMPKILRYNNFIFLSFVISRECASFFVLLLIGSYMFCWCKLHREALLSFVVSGDDVQVSGSLSVLATLLQTKGNNLTLFSYSSDAYMQCTKQSFTELDESMVDALGILPQRKQHKKKLLVCGSEFSSL